MLKRWQTYTQRNSEKKEKEKNREEGKHGY